MTKKQKKLLLRILVAAILFCVGMLLQILPQTAATPLYIRLILFLACYAVIGWDILWKAFSNILRGQIFDENFLMSLATIGALILGEYAEGVAVMLFYQVGEWFQSYAVAKSRRSIASLMDIRPDHANVERDGKLLQVDPEEVQLGETILIKPGEKVPLDGIVLSGSSTLDTAALTGEALPRDIQPGMEIISGCINQTGILRVRTTKPFGESTVARILDLVENSSEKKARTEAFITRFARYYTPFVVCAALALAILPPLLTSGSFADWVYRALTFLVISCPCALVISIPLSFFGGIGGASKCGVLVKGSNYLEALANTEIIVFDKTGTLTQGSFSVSEIHAIGMPPEKLLELAAHAEAFSNHPISLSLRQAYAGKIDHNRICDVEETAGQGISAIVDGHRILAGNQKLLAARGIACPPCDVADTVIHLAVDGTYAGFIRIEDMLKPDAAAAIRNLKACGIRRTVMLTGDTEVAGRKAAQRLQLDEVYTQLLPADKVERVEQLLQELRQNSRKGRLAFVGDGVNDAPVLARADVGIAMGALGSDAAIEAADIVLMTDEPMKIVTALQIARKTIRIAHENIFFALGVKLLILALGALGFASMWAAVFADVGVAVIAILNAMRALRTGSFLPPPAAAPLPTAIRKAA